MGTTGNLYNILKDYLSGREQYTEVNCRASSTKDITNGVPQGSILGPKLFKLLVNDLPERIADGELFMHADGTTEYFVHGNVERVIDGSNKMLQVKHQWCIANKATINTDKIEAMPITKKLFIGPLQRLTLGEEMIDLKEFVKCLGVTTDKGLNWDKEIKNVVQTHNGKLCQLKRMRFLKRNLEEIYFKSIIAGISYCIAVRSCQQIQI